MSSVLGLFAGCVPDCGDQEGGVAVVEPRDGVASFTYDQAGRMLTAATSAAGTQGSFGYQPATSESFSWDDRGLLLSAAGTAGTTSYGYNGAGQETSVADAAGLFAIDRCGRQVHPDRGPADLAARQARAAAQTATAAANQDATNAAHLLAARALAAAAAAEGKAAAAAAQYLQDEQYYQEELKFAAANHVQLTSPIS